jgi:putative oxidoreductase
METEPMAVATTTVANRYRIPALASLYEGLAPLALPLVRVTAGLLLMPHGAQKLFGAFGGCGLAGTAQFLGSTGYQPGWLWALLIALTEFAGGLCLALGFLTRPAAIAIFLFLATAVLHHLPSGFFWPQGGFEYPLLWAVVALAFAIRGGGRYSVDAALGREF